VKNVNLLFATIRGEFFTPLLLKKTSAQLISTKWLMGIIFSLSKTGERAEQKKLYYATDRFLHLLLSAKESC
jgi:hypothetical protein